MTREGVARKAGVSKKTVTRAENGGPIGKDSLLRLAEALGLEVQELIYVPAREVLERLRQHGLAAPAPPAPWVDRPGDVQQAVACLTSSPPRLCCLAGPSGIGKTALARFVVHQMGSRFPHGAIWVTASREGRPVDASQAQLRIADALELRPRLPPAEMVDADTFTDAFVAALWERERLLVLDDVLEVELVDRLVPRGAAVPVIVTTHLLHVAERLGGRTVSLGGLGVEETRRILVHHLGEARVGEDEEGVARLHETLMGVARSIHIAGTILHRERLASLGEYASRVRDDPDAGDYPEALRTPSTSLMASFAQIRHHVSSGAWLLLGALSLFDDAPFSVEWAAAAAGEPAATARAHLSELIDVFLVMQEQPRFRLDSHVPLYARGILGDRRGAALERLARHAAAAARAAHERSAWAEIRAEQVMWTEVLDTLLAAVIDRDALHAWSGVPPYEGEVRRGDMAAGLVDIVCALAPYLERERVHEGGTWLRGAAACALALGRRGDAGRLLLTLGRWWLRIHVDLGSPVRWFDAATELFVQEQMPDQAAAAASEAGRALFGCQRPAEGLARFEHAIVQARAGSERGAELACRLSSAAVSFTRQPGLEGWQRAATLLAQALEACPEAEPVDRLMRVVCACNRAAVGFVLDRAAGRPPRHRDVLDQALDAWRALDIEAPIFEARLLCLQLVFAASEECAQVDRLRDRAVALWHQRLESRATEDFLWQLGEAAFYLRLHLEHRADPDQECSPVIAQGFAVSDLSREVHFESEGLVPLGLLFPVAPLADIFDAAYIAEVEQIVEESYGPSNRILDELRAIAPR